MRAAVITHSSTFNERAEAVARYLEHNGYTAVRVFADFDHRTKQNFDPEKTDCADEFHRYVHLKPYKSNLSVSRLFHIRRFANDVRQFLEADEKEWDLLYFLLPANTFAAVGAELKDKFHCRLIFDIIDLWPESLPLKRISWLPPIRHWAALRDRNLDKADLIFTECSMYQDRLQLQIMANMPPVKTLYWFKQETSSVVTKEDTQTACALNIENTSDVAWVTDTFNVSDGEERKNKKIHVLYLGAINHIIDIAGITEVLKVLHRQRDVVLDIIGDGESRAEFIASVEAAGITVDWHGTVFDEAEKQKIMRTCTAGINMMKQGVQAGLSMKSIDYMANGLPMINNLQGDIWELTETRNLGWNVPYNFASQTPKEQDRSSAAFLNMCDTIEREAIRSVYEELFTEKAFEKALREGFSDIRNFIKE